MFRLSNWLMQISSGRVSLFLLAVFAAFTIIVLPGQAARASERTAGVGSPDSSFIYSTDDLYRMASSYGESGRRDYVVERFTFDLIWPVVYTAFLVTSTSWLIRKAGLGESRWGMLNLLPLIGAGLDYLENCLAAIVMTRFPNPTSIVDTLLPVATLLKWVAVGLSFLILVVVLFLWLSSSLRANRGTKGEGTDP